MSDDKKQSSAAKKAADAKAAKAAKSAKAAEQQSIAEAVEQPVETVELPANEPAAAPVTEPSVVETETNQATDWQAVTANAHEQALAAAERITENILANAKVAEATIEVIAVEVRSTLERRCRAGYVFGLEPVRIEGDALDTLDYGALEADPYLHVEYITGTGDA